MNATTKYELRGPGIEIAYRKGELSVNGDQSLLQDRHFSGDGSLDEATTNIGNMVTAVLDENVRVGSKVLLTLLLPVVSEQDGAAGEQVTGVAVITRAGDYGSVAQEYEAHSLVGAASDIST
ncbi:MULTISPECIES: hypothetical protein [unclassified Nonomuraea]|uniref:hypothetical protein n=1 Tax=unclassified Nonomuraea TaxID=2593643 RepID=UPI0035C144E6